MHRCECRFDAAADFRRFHIADDYKGHAVGCVVARVEVGESLARGLADDFFFADRETPRDERIGQHFGKLLLHDAVADRIAAHFFREDHAAFLVDFCRVEQRAIAEVAHDGEGELHRLLRHVGQIEHVHGLVEGGVGICVSTEGDAEALHAWHEFGGGVMFGAIENHVLEEMRETALILGFHQ